MHVTVCHSGADALIVPVAHQFPAGAARSEAARHVRAWICCRPCTAKAIATPVLMVTGYGDEQLAAQVLRAGASITSSRIGL